MRLTLSGLLLLFACACAGAQERVTAWPLLYHVSDEHKAETDVLWPLFRYERNETYTRYAFRPFIFSTESDPAKAYRETSVLWPISIYKDEEAKHWFHLFPVYWEAEGPGYSWRHAWPIFGVRHRGDSFTEYSTVWPLFTWGRDDKSGDVSVSAPWPLVHYERAGESVEHRVLPLYWYDGGPVGSSGFVLPYFWATAPDRSLRGLFPLWLSYDTPDRQADLVVPLYYRDRAPGEDLMFVTPLYFQRHAPGSTLRGLIPLYLDYDTPATRVALALPLYAHYRSAASRFSVVLPVYFHTRDDALDSEFTYYFPVYGSYRRGDVVSRHYLLFPVYARFEDRERELAGWDALWPLFHYESSPVSMDARALPLYWRSRSPDHDWTFALLYGSMDSAGRDRSWLVPFYYRSAAAESSLTLGALALLPPYYLDFHDATQSQFHVWPFYGHGRESGYDEHSVVWPLFRHGASDDGTRSMTQALLYYDKRDGDDRAWSLIPLWYHASAPRRTLDASLVIHWYEREPAADRTRWALFWLYPPDASLVRYESAPGVTKNGLFPLYTYSRDTPHDTLGWSVLWPLFSYDREGEFGRESDFLWKVVTYERKDKDTRDFRFLWRFVHDSEAPGYSLFEFNPFYYHEREEGKSDYWKVLGGLYGQRTADDGAVRRQWFWFF